MAIVEVVKYNGSPDVLAWKFPNSELGTWTQLIVNESQEAVLYKGGQSLDLFGAGRHTLETANIPILSNLVNIPFGGRSPFSAEVWYINKVTSLDIKWGTATPIQLQDPKYNVFIPLRAFGQFGIRISDSKSFLQKLVGTLPAYTTQDIIKYFRGIYIEIVKDTISKYLINKKISVLEINAFTNEISKSLENDIAPELAEFGISLVNFSVNDISVPEDDTAVMKLKDALAKKAEMDIIGYNYTQERSFDTLEGAATNNSSGSAQFMGAGMGLGMGLGIGNNMGGAFGELGKSINTSSTKDCPHCHKNIGTEYKFCPYCGKDTVPANTKHCPKCGSENPIGMKFCGSCGNLLAKICSNCGTSVDDGQKFCFNCGNSLVKKCECGNEIDGNLKFCQNCGKKVEGTDNE